MRMDVDEAGSYYFPPCVDDLTGFLPVQVTDGDNRVATDSNVGVEPGVAGAVHHFSVNNDEIVFLGLLGQHIQYRNDQERDRLIHN